MEGREITTPTVYIGVRGFHSRVILSLGAMGLGSGQLEIFVFRPLNKKNKSYIIRLVRPAGGTQNIFKTN